MRGTFGIFKGLHAGRGIYWSQGTYNVEGNGNYASKVQAIAEIDRYNAAMDAKEQADARAKAESGKYLVVTRNGEGRAVSTPDGIVLFATMREFRQAIFDLQDRYGMDSVSLTQWECTVEAQAKIRESRQRERELSDQLAEALTIAQSHVYREWTGMDKVRAALAQHAALRKPTQASMTQHGKAIADDHLDTIIAKAEGR